MSSHHSARRLPILFLALSSAAFGVTFNGQVVSTTNPQASSGCVAPPSVTSFLTTDKTVYLYFNATTTLSDHITSDWLAPDGAVLNGSDWGNPVSGYYCYPGGGLTITNTPASRLGSWQARVYANSALLFTVPFTVNAPVTASGGRIITTVAGTDTLFSGSGAPAASALLKDAANVAVDRVGNIYIADRRDQIVARVSPSGILTVIAGNGRAGFSGTEGLLKARRWLVRTA